MMQSSQSSRPQQHWKRRSSLRVFAWMALLLFTATVVSPTALAGKMEQYKELLSQVKADDAEAQFKLANWCQNNRLPQLAQKHLRLTLKADAAHAQARKLLGYVEIDGAWFTPDDAKVEKARQQYLKKLGNLKDADAGDYFKLGEFAAKNNLNTEAVECWTRSVELDPEFKKAREALHYVRLSDAWVARKEWEGAYFAIEDKAARDARYAELRDAGLNLPQQELELRYRRAHSRRDQHAGIKLTETDKYPTGEYILIAPAEIDIDKEYPLLVCLHGGGPNVGKGADIVAFYATRGKADGYIMAFPDALAHNNASEWSTPEADAYVMALIEELRKDYPVDETRIYLSGSSMGGQGCWAIGTNHPELFAGIAPICGPSYGAQFGNCKDMAVYFAHGDQDVNVSVENSRDAAKALEALGYDFTYVELPGVAHDVPIANHTPMFDIFKDHPHPHPGKR